MIGLLGMSVYRCRAARPVWMKKADQAWRPSTAEFCRESPHTRKTLRVPSLLAKAKPDGSAVAASSLIHGRNCKIAGRMRLAVHDRSADLIRPVARSAERVSASAHAVLERMPLCHAGVRLTLRGEVKSRAW